MSRGLALDRSVVLDLSRRLRSAVPHKDDAEPSRAERLDAGRLIEAVSNAASSLSAKDERIRDLERQHHEAEDLMGRMKAKLEEMLKFQQETQALARSEALRADQAETRVSQLHSRVHKLEADLDAAMGDLHRIADVITGSLLMPGRT